MPFTNLWKLPTFRLSSISVRRIFKYVFFFALVTLALFVSFSFTSPSLKSFFDTSYYVEFHDIHKMLVPRTDLNATNVCDHYLEMVPCSEEVPLIVNTTEADMEFQRLLIQPGGAWSPQSCVSKYRVNIIVPFRNRETQLWTFLYHMHPFLQRQEIDYRIVVVEQSQAGEFNRGKLFNIAFVETESRFPADCYIFTDVDLIPLNLSNIYACTVKPRHISSSLDVFDYELPYNTIFGGAVALLRSQFERVNGFSNSFYGWGGEDDDFYYRVIHANYEIIRFEPQLSRMVMLVHEKEVPNPLRFSTLKKGRYQYVTDGLKNLRYELLQFELKPYFTWIYANV